jgi:KaiC/GvpD/RAD55 family RecA-like ATPase
MSEDFDYAEPEDPDYSEEVIQERLAQEAWTDRHKPNFFLDVTSGRVVRPPWLFEDFLLSHSITLVSGEPFAGKTMFLAAMALSLDSGEPLFNSFQPASSQRVLFIGQDSPTWDYLGQFAKLGRAMDLNTTRGSMMLLNKGYDLLDPDTLQLLEETINLFNINVLMLDTLLELHTLDENSNIEMKRVMGLLKFLRDKYFLSIFATTHTAKATEGKSANYRARGASVISGSVDQHIIVRPHYAANKSDGFYFKIPKSRGESHSNDSQVVRFLPGETPTGPSLRLEYSGELYSERQEVILAALAKGLTPRKDVSLALRAKYPTWSDAELQRRTTNSLFYLEQKGLVRKVARGIYTLSEPPPQKGAS